MAIKTFGAYCKCRMRKNHNCHIFFKGVFFCRFLYLFSVFINIFYYIYFQHFYCIYLLNRYQILFCSAVTALPNSDNALGTPSGKAVSVQGFVICFIKRYLIYSRGIELHIIYYIKFSFNQYKVFIKYPFHYSFTFYLKLR